MRWLLAFSAACAAYSVFLLVVVLHELRPRYSNKDKL